jgi:hypothetical protein
LIGITNIMDIIKYLELGKETEDPLSSSGKIDREAFKRAIGMIESSGGKYLDSNTSSAAGKYHFLYNLIKKDPLLKGMTKREFMNNPELQEKIMDKAIEGKLEGYPGYERHANNLKSEYDTDLSVTEIAALTHFLGAGGVRKYLRDPNQYKAPGVNATPKAYIERFRKHSGIKNENLDTNNPSKSFMDQDVRQAMEIPKDGVNIRQPQIRKDLPMSQEPQFLQNKTIDTSSLEDSITGQEADTGVIPLGEQVEGGTPETAQFLTEMVNQNAMGGKVSTTMDTSQPQVIEYNEGGTHEENIHGGVPVGMGDNGKMNTVEEGETKFNDYVFSNRFGLDGPIDRVDDGANKFAEGGYTEPVDPPGSKKNMKPTEVTKTFHRGISPVTKTDVIEPFSQMPGFDGSFDKYILDDNQSPAYKQKKQFVDWYSDPASVDKAAKNHSVGRNLLNDGIVRGAMTNLKKADSFSATNNAISDPKTRTIEMQDANNDEVAGHELGHASNLDALFGEKLNEILGNPWMSQKNRDPNNPDKAIGNKDHKNYLKSNHEAYGNFHEFRLKLGIKPGEELSPEDLKKRVKEKGLENNMFYKNFDDEKISKAISTVASNDKPQPITEYRIA